MHTLFQRIVPLAWLLVRAASVVACASLAFVADAARQVVAQETSRGDYTPGDKIPLSESDLRMITLQVLQSHPLLSSSPGVKYASAYRGYPTTDTVEVIFHPHLESGGVKQAFQVHCQRQITEGAWECPFVEIRRYLRLESQDFEVRVKGDIGREAALALIEASRDTARATATEGSAVPDTANMIFSSADGYQVSWGTRDGMGGVLVRARLRKDGNPVVVEDWETSVVEPEE